MLNFLASYPKSGNTWVRIFLDAYLNDHVTDINDIRSSWGDDIARYYNYLSGVSMSKYPIEEQVLMRHAALMRIDWQLKDLFPHLVKTHNLNFSIDGVRLFPSQITNKVLYIVRDPRDVVISFSKHFGKTIDDTIDSFSDEKYGMRSDPNEKLDKVVSYLSTWNNHVQSWVTATDLNVLTIRYEDLLDHTEDAFGFILKWFDIPIHEKRLLRAIEASSFSRLKKVEEEVGFKEASYKTDKFFSNGTYGKWKDKLTNEQANRVVEVCRPSMELLNYVDKIDA